MDLVLVLLIGAAVGFSVGIYVARQYGASPKLEIWKREIIRDISSQLSQRSQELNNPDKALIKLSEGLVDKISQKLQEKLQAVQATLEEFKFRLADSQQSLLQDWSRDLLQAISVKLAEHGQQLNNQLAILENLVEEAKDIYRQLRVTIQSSHGSEICPTANQDSQNEQVTQVIGKAPDPETPDEVLRDKDGTATVDISKIESFLNSKNIKIKIKKRSIDMEEKEKELDQIADLMGSQYSLIKRFYRMIKSSMNSGNSFSIDLRDEPQQVIDTTRQLATELHKIAFLEEYRYSEAPKCLLEARASRSKQALNFLSGNWLERYVRNRLICLAKRQTGKIDFPYVANVEVTLSNRDDFEMDLLFYVNDQLYWVESKTGKYKYRDKVKKYSKIASDLGFQRNQAIIVLTDVSQDAKTDLSSRYHLSVISVDEVEATFERILIKSPSRSLKGTREH
jgi:hypothetical protein